MADSFIFGAYWGSRAEPLAQAANKVLQTLKRLGEIDELFLNLYEVGRSRKEALKKKVSLELGTINRICQEAAMGELDSNGFAKNGFVFSLWTGHKDEESSSISFAVGDIFKIPNLTNSCVIKLPREDEAKKRLLQEAKKIIFTLVQIWEPDYAVLTSNEVRDKLMVGNRIGWITYRKTIKNTPKISNKVLHERSGQGHLFYFNSPNGPYDHSLLNELEPIKSSI